MEGRGREEYLRQGRAPGLPGNTQTQPLARQSPRLAEWAHPIRMAPHIPLHPVLPAKLCNSDLPTQVGVGLSLLHRNNLSS